MHSILVTYFLVPSEPPTVDEFFHLTSFNISRSQSAKMGDEAKKSEPEPSNSAAASPAASLASTSDEFDMENLFKYFSECYGEDGSALRMDSYIKGYEEIVKFLNLLGTVFGWVASDVVAKIRCLNWSNNGMVKNYVDKFAHHLNG